MILERDGELRTLSGFVDDLTVAGGRVALVRGEAGIGKSTLVERFVAEESARAHVLVGACDDLLTPQPFGPVWDIARREPTVAAPLSHGDTRAVMEALLALLSCPARPTVLVMRTRSGPTRRRWTRSRSSADASAGPTASCSSPTGTARWISTIRSAR